LRDLREDTAACLEIAWPDAPMQALDDSRKFLAVQAALLEGNCSHV